MGGYIESGELCPAGDTGGDYQMSEAWSRRFVREAPDGEHLVVTVAFYVERPPGLPVPQIMCQIEYVRCTDPRDPGATEQYADYTFAAVDGNVSEDRAKALCEQLRAEDIEWDGSRIVHEAV